MRTARLAGVLFSGLLAPIIRRAQAPSFPLVGAAPNAGGTGSRVTALSADGRVAAGFSIFDTGALPGFKWTGAGGRTDFGLLPGMPHQSPVAGVSADGSVVVGSFNALGSPPPAA